MLWNYRARDLSFRNADNPPRNLRCALLLISRRSDHLPYPARLCDFECERWVARARACFGLLFAPSQTCQICSTTRGAVSGLLEKTCRRMAFGARPSACLPPSAMPSEGSLRSPACSLYVHIVPLLVHRSKRAGMADQIVITEVAQGPERKTSAPRWVRATGTSLPAEGHPFDLLEPEDVVPDWKRWSPILLRPEGL